MRELSDARVASGAAAGVRAATGQRFKEAARSNGGREDAAKHNAWELTQPVVRQVAAVRSDNV